MRNIRRQVFAFTLIELLVVIAIIAILASILLPAMNAAFRKAEKTQALTDIKSIETAVKAFYSDYGKFPQGNGNPGGSDDFSYGGVESYSVRYRPNSELMNVLRGLDSTNNPRKTVYLEVPQDSLGTDSATTNSFIDPWGQQYEITIDTGFNNSCDDMKGGYTGVVNKVVAVWSRGPDTKAPIEDVNTKDDVKSWE